MILNQINKSKNILMISVPINNLITVYFMDKVENYLYFNIQT